MRRSHSSPTDVKDSSTYTPGFSAIGRRSYDSGTLRANDDLQKIIKEAQEIIMKNENMVTSLSREVAMLKGMNENLIDLLRREQETNLDLTSTLAEEMEYIRQFPSSGDRLSIVIENADETTPSSRGSMTTNPPEPFDDSELRNHRAGPQ